MLNSKYRLIYDTRERVYGNVLKIVGIEAHGKIYEFFKNIDNRMGFHLRMKIKYILKSENVAIK